MSSFENVNRMHTNKNADPIMSQVLTKHTNSGERNVNYFDILRQKLLFIASIHSPRIRITPGREMRHGGVKGKFCAPSDPFYPSLIQTLPFYLSSSPSPVSNAAGSFRLYSRRFTRQTTHNAIISCVSLNNFLSVATWASSMESFQTLCCSSNQFSIRLNYSSSHRLVF